MRNLVKYLVPLEPKVSFFRWSVKVGDADALTKKQFDSGLARPSLRGNGKRGPGNVMFV